MADRTVAHIATLRSDAWIVFDASEASQEVRDVIEWYDASLRVLATAPHAAEPVTQWQKRHGEQTDGRWLNTDANDAIYWRGRPGWEVRALYATAFARKVPMTKVEIAQLSSRWDGEVHGPLDAFMVRETERFFGIPTEAQA